jgi:hypothetical protein
MRLMGSSLTVVAMEHDWAQEQARLDARALRALKLEAAARRRRRLRTRVLAAAATIFVVAWSTLFAQSYLKGSASASTPAPTTTSGATTGSSATQETTPSGDGTYGDDGYGYTDDGSGYYSYGGGTGSGVTSQPVAPQVTTPAPVTTSQS